MEWSVGDWRGKGRELAAAWKPTSWHLSLESDMLLLLLLLFRGLQCRVSVCANRSVQGGGRQKGRSGGGDYSFLRYGDDDACGQGEAKEGSIAVGRPARVCSEVVGAGPGTYVSRVRELDVWPYLSRGNQV